MKCYGAVFALVLGSLLASARAQQSPPGSTIFCTFQDGKEINVQYQNSESVKKTNFSSGKLWSPGRKPMFLFTQTNLTVANAEIPMGAYSLYFIPGNDHWTLVLNKSVQPGEYNPREDLVRVAMDVGQLSELQPFSLAFAHTAPKQCNLRLYEGKIGTWAEFHEK